MGFEGFAMFTKARQGKRKIGLSQAIMLLNRRERKNNRQKT